MKITLEPTEIVRTVNGCDCREWKGTDDQGVEINAMVIAVTPLTHDKDVAERYRQALIDRGFARATPIDLRNIL